MVNLVIKLIEPLKKKIFFKYIGSYLLQHVLDKRNRQVKQGKRGGGRGEVFMMREGRDT